MYMYIYILYIYIPLIVYSLCYNITKARQSFRILRRPDERTLSNFALISVVNKLALPATLCLMSHLYQTSKLSRAKSRRSNAHIKECVQVPLMSSSESWCMRGVVGQQEEGQVQLQGEEGLGASVGGAGEAHDINRHTPLRCLHGWNKETEA